MHGYRRGKAREGRVGGFPEPERAVRGLPKPQGCCVEKSHFRESARKVLLARKNLPARARLPARVSIRR